MGARCSACNQTVSNSRNGIRVRSNSRNGAGRKRDNRASRFGFKTRDVGTFLFGAAFVDLAPLALEKKQASGECGCSLDTRTLSGEWCSGLRIPWPKEKQANHHRSDRHYTREASWLDRGEASQLTPREKQVLHGRSKPTRGVRGGSRRLPTCARWNSLRSPG